METILNRKNPTIDSGLLVGLSKSGRNVLAYIIDRYMDAEGNIELDRLTISNHIAKTIGKKEANPWNVERGIKDLCSNGVIAYVSMNMYRFNRGLLSK